MKPTYSTIEALRMLRLLDSVALNKLCEILDDEKRRYCLVDLELMKRNIDLVRLKIK